MNTPFWLVALPPGTMSSKSAWPYLSPIIPVPGIPGGTIMNPVPRPGTRATRDAPHLSGTGAYIPRSTVLRLAANASRGSGHNSTRAPQALVHAGTRTPGVHSNGSMVRALSGMDIRHPLIAPYLLSYGMRAGATRLR